MAGVPSNLITGYPGSTDSNLATVCNDSSGSDASR
jgi:hypothetical protein